MSTQLARLSAWYRAQCDGSWEHAYGVKIDTLDNPGWSMDVDLVGTGGEGRVLQRVHTERDEDDWVCIWSDGRVFSLRCGPQNLEQGLEQFLAWIE